MNDIFCKKRLEDTLTFYQTRAEWHNILDYRTLTQQVKPVENIFFGDSITWAWPFGEFFPGLSFLNRGIPGDNVTGLNYRLNDDVLAYTPKRVFIMIGINGIQEEKDLIIARTRAVAQKIADSGSQVWLASILPLRNPDAWDRFQYQDKIVEINRELAQWSNFLDYHSLLKDETGQLAAEYAKPDGTHLTFAAYVVMSKFLSQIISKGE